MTSSDRPAAASLLLALAVAAAAGCGGPAEEGRMARRTVEVAEVPEDIRETARGALPGVDFESAWQNVDAEGELHSYELRGRVAETGKIREVRVSTVGEVLEME